MSATLGRVADAPDQADLSLVAELDWPPHVLPSLPWKRPLSPQGEPLGEYAGVGEYAEVRHLATTALMNDLARNHIMADVRLHPDAFAELLRDEHRPTRGLRPVKDAQGTPIGFEIQGPAPGEWLPNNSLARGYRPGAHWWRFTTTGWAEVPAFVAYWFWWQQKGDARLGAAYQRSKRPEEREPDEPRTATVSVPGVTQRMILRRDADAEGVEPEPTELFVVRMESERAPGERPSGLIDPSVRESETALAAAQAQIAALQRQLELLNKKPPKGQEG